MVRNLVILGSTGSIGRQTLDVAAHFPDSVRVFGLSAGRNLDLLRRQVADAHPAVVVTQEQVGSLDNVETLHGEEGLIELVSRPEVQLVVVGTVGAVGLRPTLAALDAGKLVALANKEVLVAAGGIIQERLRSGRGELVPIDSEHSAIWQCLRGEPRRAVESLTLTASGGAFRNLSLAELADVTPEQALQHPTWSMGKKITVDSATLMNKGLEAIEARWLFDIGLDQVNVVQHSQSIVHSLVTFNDSSVKAQLGIPDMRLPIQYALSYPERWINTLPRLDLSAIGHLDFGPIDLDRFPALGLALEAGERGGTYPAVLCAADEAAVSCFLCGAISFLDIPAVVRSVLDAHNPCSSPDLDHILEADSWARLEVARLIRMQGI